MSGVALVDGAVLGPAVGPDPESVVHHYATGNVHLLAMRHEGRLVQVCIVEKGDAYHVLIEGSSFLVSFAPSAPDRPVSAVDDGVVRAPMACRVARLHCMVGDRIRAGDPVVQLEAMKLSSLLLATRDGTIQSIEVQEGDALGEGQLVVVVG